MCTGQASLFDHKLVTQSADFGVRAELSDFGGKLIELFELHSFIYQMLVECLLCSKH